MRTARAWQAGFATLLGLAAIGCAGRAWEEARAQDTPGAYRRFLDESPGSEHAPAALERLDYLVAKRNPTAEAVGRFREAHSGSAELAELESLLESRSFEAARVDGSVAAYRRFLAQFPAGALAGRASANLAYLLHDGFSRRPADLRGFLESHAAGDHLDEAHRTLALLDERRTGSFRSAALRIEIDPALGAAERLRRQFSERAEQAFAGSGVRLIRDGMARADAVLTIAHVESSVPTELYEGRMEGPGVLARTQVSLVRAGDDDPIWAESFELRVPVLERRGRDSVLFTRRASTYWARFFVPVATWPTQDARRGGLSLREGAVAVAGDVDRTIALFRDGSFLELDLADPAAPRLVSEYPRRADLAEFSGLRWLGQQVVLFGADGLELVDRNAGNPRRLRALGREHVGAVTSVEAAEGTLWIAGSRGLLRTPLAGGPVEVVVQRPLQGLAIDGANLYVVDDRRLHGVALADVRAERFEPVLDLGRTFGASGLRMADGYAAVLGRKGVLTARLRGVEPAHPLSRLGRDEFGPIADVMIRAPRAFLIGERGLQILTLSSGRMADSVDVTARSAISGAGRHLVVLDREALQVVDAAPWMDSGAAALGRPME
ncbi:hypothetical protein KJ059_04970 [Myxococcota bacterium]|nr:hypothetical protein [Myxococcota bacterium]